MLLQWLGQMELCLVTGVEDHSPGKWSETTHCTLHTVHPILCTLCTLDCAHCAHKTAHCLLCTLCTALCTLCITLCSVHTMRCTVPCITLTAHAHHSPHTNYHSQQCNGHICIALCTLYTSVQCTLPHVCPVVRRMWRLGFFLWRTNLPHKDKGQQRSLRYIFT